MGTACCNLPEDQHKEKKLVNMAQSIHEATHDDKFRKSSNTPFYGRQNKNMNKYNYFIHPPTVHVENDKEFHAVICDLFDAKNTDKQLQLIISRVIGDVVRVSVKEYNNDKRKKKRYEINDDNDVLTRDARVPLAFEKVECTEHDAILSWSTYTLKIFYQPFTVYIYESDQMQILINNGNKFYFETYSDTPRKELALHHTYYHDDGYSSIGLDFDFVQSNEQKEEEIHLFGLPSHSTAFALPSTDTFEDHDAYRLYNLDVYKYKLHSPASLYGCIPHIIHHNASTTNSVLWCNASETFVTIHDRAVNEYNSKNVRFLSQTGALEAFILLHKNTANKSYLSQYYALSGVPQLPPLFAVAHHQCRWNYNDEKDVMEVNDKFDEYEVPNDVIWLDIEHTDQKKYLTWSPHAFPDPERLIARLSDADTQRKLVCIVDPHIKKDEEYYIYNEIEKNKDYWVRTREDTPYEAQCWPVGPSLYPDFINPKMRELWSAQFHVVNPNVFVWNDMNEPAVFNACESTMPISNKHTDGIHYDLRHKEIHNLYGHYFHKASFEGLLARNSHYGMKQRPFLLSRSFFIGSQKYGAIWTGDNKSNWKHLQISIPMLLSLSVAGMPFVGADVGGFFGNCKAQLMQRWYNLAVYYPFFRNHSCRNTRRQELWMFDVLEQKKENDGFRNKECVVSMKGSIIQRYKLLPYVYTLFYLSHAQGHPIMRPLWYEFQDDIDTFEREDAFMFGDALFVAPIVTKDTEEVSVVLPQKENVVYYELRNKGKDAFMVNVFGMNEEKDTKRAIRLVDYKFEAPVLRVGGKMTVEKHKYLRRSSALMKKDPITIIVALDSNYCAESQYYLDDGETLNHLESDEYLLSQLTFDGSVFENKILHSNAAVDACTIYQIWILMAETNRVEIESVTVNSKESETVKKLDECYYKTPHLLIVDNVDIAVNFDFKIVFQ